MTDALELARKAGFDETLPSTNEYVACKNDIRRLVALAQAEAYERAAIWCDLSFSAKDAAERIRALAAQEKA